MKNAREEAGARLVPTELAALAAGVGKATIRKWASRGKITRYGSSRRALYDLDELFLLLGDRPAAGAGRSAAGPMATPSQ